MAEPSIAERIKDQSAQYQVQRLRENLRALAESYSEVTSSIAEVEADREILADFVLATCSDLPSEVAEVIARVEERRTVRRIGA